MAISNHWSIIRRLGSCGVYPAFSEVPTTFALVEDNEAGYTAYVVEGG